jgi:hypothetical protein
LNPAEVASVLVRDHGYTEADARAAAADAGGSIARALEARDVDLTDARAAAQQVLQLAARATDPTRRLDAAKALAVKGASPAAEREQLAVSLRSLGSMLRDLSVVSHDAAGIPLANQDLAEELGRLAPAFDPRRSTRAFAAVDAALAALERNVNPKVIADWVVLQL